MIESLVALALTACAADRGSMLCRFPAPPALAGRHVRLEVGCPQETVHVNGIAVPGGPAVRNVKDLLVARGENTVRMSLNCVPAKLLVTPRVYIASIYADTTAASAAGLSVTVENSLDNTVNVAVSCRGPAGEATSSATIPANGQTQLTLAVRPLGDVTCVLAKASEALEESYDFQMKTHFQ